MGVSIFRCGEDPRVGGMISGGPLEMREGTPPGRRHDVRWSSRLGVGTKDYSDVLPMNSAPAHTVSVRVSVIFVGIALVQS